MEGKRVKAISWIFTFIMLCIPVVNVIYCLGLALGISQYKSKVSYARAQIILIILAIIAFIIYLAVIYIQTNQTFKFDEFGKYLQDYFQTLIEQYKQKIPQFNQ